MSNLVNVDVSDPDLFKPMVFKVLPAGKHLFEVANDLKVEDTKTPGSTNKVVNIELVCQDEDDNKGARAWDKVVIIASPQTEKEKKAVKINQGKLCQLAVACGVLSRADIESGAGIDLTLFKGTRCEAITKVEPYTSQATQETKQRAAIVKYLFEPAKS